MFKSLEKYSIMLKEVVLNIKLLIVYILNEGDILNIYIAIVLGLIFVFLSDMDYRRRNNSTNMDKKMIKISFLHSVITLIMVSLAIYLSYFK